MRVAFLSDLHESSPHIHNGVDIVVFAGDFVNTVDDPSYEKRVWNTRYKPYFEEIRSRGIHVVGIPGNHDFLPETGIEERKIVADCFDTFLTSGFRTILGMRFYFYCYSNIKGHAYYRSETEHVKHLHDIKIRSVDFVVTHIPARNILSGKPEWGSEAVGNFVSRMNPVWGHAFGHAHIAKGVVYKDKVWRVNASYANRNNEPTHWYVVWDDFGGGIFKNVNTFETTCGRG